MVRRRDFAGEKKIAATHEGEGKRAKHNPHRGLGRSERIYWEEDTSLRKETCWSLMVKRGRKREETGASFSRRHEKTRESISFGGGKKTFIQGKGGGARSS